jgi:hypothetical protein
MPFKNLQDKRNCKARSQAKRYAESEDIREKTKATTKAWADAHPEDVRQAGRRARLKKLGWTLESVEQAKTTQEGRCGMCYEVKPLFPDHEHVDPPKPRNLLCQPCNQMLGWYEKMVREDMVKAAAAYLRKWS